MARVVACKIPDPLNFVWFICRRARSCGRDKSCRSKTYRTLPVTRRQLKRSPSKYLDGRENQYAGTIYQGDGDARCYGLCSATAVDAVRRNGTGTGRFEYSWEGSGIGCGSPSFFTDLSGGSTG